MTAPQRFVDFRRTSDPAAVDVWTLRTAGDGGPYIMT